VGIWHSRSSPPSAPRREAVARPPWDGGWRAVPPRATTVRPDTGGITDGLRFRAGLASWQNPAFASELGHAVLPSAPTGLVHGVLRSLRRAERHGGGPLLLAMARKEDVTSETSTVVRPATEKQPSTVVRRLTERQPSTVVRQLTERQPSTVVRQLTEQQPSTVVRQLTERQPSTVVRSVAERRPTTAVRPVPIGRSLVVARSPGIRPRPIAAVAPVGEPGSSTPPRATLGSDPVPSEVRPILAPPVTTPPPDRVAIVARSADAARVVVSPMRPDDSAAPVQRAGQPSPSRQPTRPNALPPVAPSGSLAPAHSVVAGDAVGEPVAQRRRRTGIGAPMPSLPVTAVVPGPDQPQSLPRAGIHPARHGVVHPVQRDRKPAPVPRVAIVGEPRITPTRTRPLITQRPLQVDTGRPDGFTAVTSPATARRPVARPRWPAQPSTPDSASADEPVTVRPKPPRDGARPTRTISRQPAPARAIWTRPTTTRTQSRRTTRKQTQQTDTPPRTEAGGLPAPRSAANQQSPTDVRPTGTRPTNVPPAGTRPTDAPPTGSGPTGVPMTGALSSRARPAGMPTIGARPADVPTTGARPAGVPTTGARTANVPTAAARPVGGSPLPRAVLVAARPAMPPPTPVAAARLETRAVAPVPAATTEGTGSRPAIQRSPGTTTPVVPRQSATTDPPHRPTPVPRTGTQNRAAAPIQRASPPPVTGEGRSAADEPPDLDDLARRLIEPVARLLRSDLRRGRERAGRPHDGRR
jgi:syndecan 1